MGFLGAMEVLGAASATIGCEDLLGRVGDSKHLSRGESMSDKWFVGFVAMGGSPNNRLLLFRKAYRFLSSYGAPIT